MVHRRSRGHAARWLVLPLAGLLLGAAPKAGDSLRAHYTVTLVGLHIGDLYADGTLGPQSYKVALNARLTGLAAMVSNVKMALASSGAVRKGSLSPSAYATSAANTNETRTLRMALAGGTVRAVEIMPPPEFRGDRVPVSEADKRNILDPTSALIMTVPAQEALVGPAACNRTLPIYDGYARFDIQLGYAGQRDVAIGGYSGPVSVCTARYRPISGHLMNSKATQFMADNTEIEVWLAPIEHAHVVVPMRVTMPTTAGNLSVEAVELETSPPEAGGDAITR